MGKRKNIRDWRDEFKRNGGILTQLYYQVAKATGCQTVTAERWFKMERTPRNEKAIAYLEKLTQIERTYLFRK